MDFPEQSRFLTMCPWKKITGLPGSPFVPFWLGVPDLSRLAYLCSRVLTHRWPKLAQNLSLCTKKIAGSRGSALDPAGSAHDAPPDRQVGPLTTRACGARTLRFRLQRSSRTAVPKLWSPYTRDQQELQSMSLTFQICLR